MGFQDLKTTEKGNIGEALIDEKLFKKGFHLYKPNLSQVIVLID